MNRVLKIRLLGNFLCLPQSLSHSSVPRIDSRTLLPGGIATGPIRFYGLKATKRPQSRANPW